MTPTRFRQEAEKIVNGIRMKSLAEAIALTATALACCRHALAKTTTPVCLDCDAFDTLVGREG